MARFEKLGKPGKPATRVWGGGKHGEAVVAKDVKPKAKAPAKSLSKKAVSQ